MERVMNEILIVILLRGFFGVTNFHNFYKIILGTTFVKRYNYCEWELLKQNIPYKAFSSLLLYEIGLYLITSKTNETIL